MIDALKMWTQNIIIAVVISIIIEMILPDGNNKKYVKVVSGLYILYMIVNPILGLNENINLNEITELIIDENVVQTVSSSDISKTYIVSLQDALKAQIENLGYKVDNVSIIITSDYSDIVSINIKMRPIVNYDVNKVIEVVQKNYEIEKDKINIS